MALFTNNQLSILVVLLHDPDGEMHFRKLARRVGKEAGVLQKALNALEAQGLVKSRRRGNQRLVSFNNEHPFAGDVKSIVEKSAGAISLLKDIVLKVAGLETAFIFGSYAKGCYVGHSDIDLIVIGNPKCESLLTRELNKLEKKLGREINFKLYDTREFQRRLKNKDPFLKEILSNKFIPLKGKL